MRDRWSTMFLLGGLIVLGGLGLPVYAATPLDGMFVNLLGSMPLWGQALVGLGGIILALAGLYLLHAGPTVLMGIIIGFGILLVIAAAATGQLFTWLTSIAI